MEPSQRIEMISYNNKKYGTIWKEKLPGGITMVSTESVQDAEKIFRAESKYPERPGLDAVIAYRMDNKDKFNSPGLVTNGKSWWDVRSVAQQALLKPKITNNYTPRIGQVADDFIDRSLSLLSYRYYFFFAIRNSRRFWQKRNLKRPKC